MWQSPSVEDAGRTGSAEAWEEYTKNGRTTQCRLRNQVHAAMWPTPNTKDGTVGEHISEKDSFEIGPTGSLRKINQQGTNGSAGLGRAVHLWPTPCASEAEIAPGPNCHQKSLTSIGNRPSYQKAKEMWATPAARDYRSPNHNGNFKDQLPNQCGGQLNPDWVESMVGLPIGWTNPEVKEISRKNPNQWPAFMGQTQQEWEPPRTCGKMPNRTKRLKMCGNICVPQQVYPILQAIADIERRESIG